ncbi:MAG: P1 family peptidase [Acidimicrobiia bacterium]|nr:P1 family peptidase [Acidimicrobiia bacterium]
MALGIPAVRVGCWTSPTHPTGCTVVLPPAGTVGGACVRGGAPGTREVAALSATGSVNECHAVLLTGGSAFGLAAADGVMAWCESQGLGFETATARVPIVGAAVVFDLRVEGQPRPDRDAGWAACEAAVDADPAQGSVGAGAGCTVGKVAGRDHVTKGGQGWAVTTRAGVTVGALMVVNAVGEVLAEDGSVLAGTTAPPGAPRFPDASAEQIAGWAKGAEGSNTVIGCVVTDARLTKSGVCRVADLAHGGIARAVHPPHTSMDGDTMFALATGAVQPEGGHAVDLVADLAASAVAAAVRAAVRHATPIDGAPVDPRSR